MGGGMGDSGTKPTSQPAAESMLSSSIIELYKTLQAPEMQRLKPGFLPLLGTIDRDVISHFRLEEALSRVSVCPAAATYGQCVTDDA
jgi:hypothetical protein